MTLLLYGRPTRSNALLGNITQISLDWRRSIQRVGGYYLGSFEVRPTTQEQLIERFDKWIGCRLVERTFGITSWEGLIYEMRLVLNGIEYVRSLEPELWHNRMKVIYSDSDGARQSATWSENTNSSDEYGEAQYVLTLGGSTSAAATALRNRHLLEHAWPRSRMVSGRLQAGARGEREDGLSITVAGFWATLNWRYRETNIIDSAYNAVVTLVGAAELVSIGRAEANGLGIFLESEPIPQRLGDLLEEAIGQGDSSDNVWQGGVYANRKFVYEQAPTNVTHYLRDGRLVDMAGTPVVPELVEPGFLLLNANAPTGGQPPGTSSPWDDPRVAYVDEVEFISPDSLQLHLHGTEEGLLALEMKIRGAAEGLPFLYSPGQEPMR